MRKGFLVLGLIVGCIIFSVAEAEEIRYDKGDRRDPFSPIMNSRNKTLGNEGFNVGGIVFDPKGGSYVLMGGQIYREGETLEDATIIKIMPNRIILLQGSKQVVLWLREEALEVNQKENGRGDEKG